MINFIYKNQNGLLTQMPITKLNQEISRRVMEKFNSKYVQKVISNKFDDNEWVAFDQKYNVHLNFEYKKEEAMKCCKKHKIDYSEFINILKFLVVLQYGTLSLSLIRDFIKFIIDSFLVSDGFIETKTIPQFKDMSDIDALINFVVISGYANDSYLSFLKKQRNGTILKKYGKENDKQTTLNEFRSYFVFDELLNKFWNTASLELKNFYYPLYIFWRITTILPLRVTEFCITPYDCIEQKGDLYYLTIKRSLLKGSTSINPKVHYYDLEKDYVRCQYEIPENVYQLIKGYQELTKDYLHPYGTLFSVEYLKKNQVEEIRTNNINKVFVARDLGELIHLFYKNHISEYGYKIVLEEDLINRYMDEDGSYTMANDEIMIILAKHTRHLAMCNLVFRGVNPITIKEFAGHTNETTSAHYYSNISKTVRCATKIMYNRVKSYRESVDIDEIVSNINPLAVLIDQDQNSIEVDNGRCYSERFCNNCFEDCQKVGGECKHCEFFVPNKNITNEEVKRTEKEIDNEIKYIHKMLRNKKIADKIEEYQVRTHHLQTKTKNLSKYYMDQFIKEGEKHGQEK